VGLCSYLLIGFYFDQEVRHHAGNKAFIVNRIGDFGFSLAMFLIVINSVRSISATVFAPGAGRPPPL
jgi:NADH-quinone oxidoreductase subunit L